MALPANWGNRTGGARANATGTAWQAQIEACAYRHDREVALTRINDGVKRSGPGGKVLIPLRQPFDFAGTLPVGLALFFDAKTTDRVTGLPANLMKDHQLEALARQRAVGAVAGLLVYAQAPGDIRWLDVQHLAGPRGKPVAVTVRWDDRRWLILGRYDPHRPRIDWPRLAQHGRGSFSGR